MKLLPALALLVLSLSFCNMLGKRNTAKINVNTNTQTASTNSNSSSSTTSGSSSSMTDDEKHKLFQAAGMTRDQETILEVSKKIGILSANNTPTGDYQSFVNSHMDWARSNIAFIREVSTAEKAKEYVDKHR